MKLKGKDPSGLSIEALMHGVPVLHKTADQGLLDFEVVTDFMK